jgi:hypothetical protein
MERSGDKSEERGCFFSMEQPSTVVIWLVLCRTSLRCLFQEIAEGRNGEILPLRARRGEPPAFQKKRRNPWYPYRYRDIFDCSADSPMAH